MAKTLLYNNENSNCAQLILFNENGVISVNKLGVLTTIGRKTQSNSCDICIELAYVSRNHCQIAFADSKYFFKDTNSTNGTYINSKLFGGNNKDELVSQLNDGDILCFDYVVDDKQSDDRIYGLFTTSACCDGEFKSIPLSNDIAEICIGRSDESSLQIDNQMISEKHASFFLSSNGWAIIDHKSTNGVFLNNRKLNSPRYLKKLDIVRIVDTLFIFTQDNLFYSQGSQKGFIPAHEKKGKEAVKETPLNNDVVAKQTVITPKQTAVNSENKSEDLVINIVERSVVQRFKKLILLQDINLSISNGEMVLILGGSGAGKTTFINAVMGYEKADGKIIYNDTDIYEEYELMKYEIGFVPQQDLLRGSDTVYDTLSNAAQMKLPRRISFEKREERIHKVLEDLGLSREKETLVSKLSGGQRKRLSIAIEFIANPSLFFLDEPDSGVDDIMGRGLMENLRAIADQGKIVMVITHSPERAADLFDKVIVLAKSTKDNCGHLAFYGTTKEAFEFFSVSSFREIVKKINRSDENGEGLSDYFIEKYEDYCKR